VGANDPSPGARWASPGLTDTVTVVEGPRKGVQMTTYSREFKDQIVQLHRKGRSFMDLAKEFNIAATSVSNWVREADRHDAVAARASSEGAETDKARIRRLEKELARREEELEILGKALAFFARQADQ
jgi:transposase